MCNLNSLSCLLGTKDNSMSSLRLSDNRYKSVGFPAFMGLTWDLEDVLHRWGRQEFMDKCRRASFVVQKEEASSMMARVVPKMGLWVMGNWLMANCWKQHGESMRHCEDWPGWRGLYWGVNGDQLGWTWFVEGFEDKAEEVGLFPESD